ncbi:MAG: hypothetical protein IKR48_13420 [Kiritimatiellae bacterium]|nr:hypothetical protein [Kiritimatiellia bacterium]
MRIGLFFLFISGMFHCAADMITSVTVQQGESFVRSYYREYGFEKGCFDYARAAILPFAWRLGTGSLVSLISTPVDNDGPGAHWRFIELKRGDVRELEMPSNGIYFAFSQVYGIALSDGRVMPAFYKERFRRDRDKSLDTFIDGTTWYGLDVSPDGKPISYAISDDTPQLLARQDFRSIVHVLPFFYEGEKAVVSNSGALGHLGMEATNFQQMCRRNLDKAMYRRLACRHAEWLRAKTRAKTATVFYFVLSDTNGDGVCDAYVSSNVEASSGDSYEWTLYLGGRGGEFSRQVNPLSFRAVNEIIYIDQKVVASPRNFFRVSRHGIPPYVLPVVKGDSGVILSYPYLIHESVSQRYRKDKGKVIFSDCVPFGQHGVGDIQDIFSTISPNKVMRVDRLDCEKYVLEETPGKPRW